jgi:hypothetical protein
VHHRALVREDPAAAVGRLGREPGRVRRPRRRVLLQDSGVTKVLRRAEPYDTVEANRMASPQGQSQG